MTAALLKPLEKNTFPKIQVNLTDANVIAGIENLRTVLNLPTATNPKLVGAAVSIDPAQNVFVGTQGVLKTIPFYQRIIVICCSLINSLFKLIKETYQPAIVTLQSKVATLESEAISAGLRDAKYREENETREVKYLEEVTTAKSTVGANDRPSPAAAGRQS